MSEKYTYRGSTVYEYGEELSTIDVVDLLNEQQATINKLNKRNEYLKKELNKQIMLLNIVGERLKDD